MTKKNIAESPYKQTGIKDKIGQCDVIAKDLKQNVPLS
jgi:hypothetical protein